jgi:hypothetical protein
MRARAATILCVALAGCGGGSALPPDAGPGDDAPIGEPLPPLAGAGYALAFDGVDDYATAGNGGFVTAAGTMTIELWVRFESGVTDQDFVALRLNFESGVRIGIHAGTIAVRRVYVDRVLTAAPALPSANAWHHIAYTFDYATNALFVDGVQVDAQMTPTDDRTPNQVWLGSIDGVNALFRGRMDEVRVWAVTRSAADIQADMRRGPVAGQDGTIDGLVAYWTFDDDRTGGRSGDSSGRGNDVTLGDGIAARMPARVASDAPVGD